MIVDSSALVAIVFQEPGFENVLARFDDGPPAGIGTPTLAEAGVVLTARLGSDATALLGALVRELDIVEIPFGDAHWREAVRAWHRYGRGRHTARLNFGDCLAYAVARLADEPLLYTGHDFNHTDIRAA